jgi:peptidoglycan hydrolase CwlO-like protein
MYTIREAVRDIISQKRQSIKYRQEEADRIYREVSKEQDEIFKLEEELKQLDKHIQSTCMNQLG